MKTSKMNYFWEEPDGWRSWRLIDNRYYFNDIADNLVATIDYTTKINGGGYPRKTSTLHFINNDIIHI